MRRLRRVTSLVPALCCALAAATPGLAAEFHVDPAAGAPGNDGSASAPWSTLERAVADGKFGAVVRAGDTVWLHAGYHGDVVLGGGAYSPPIRIAAASGAAPRVRRLSFTNTRGWLVTGLDVSPSHAATYAKVSMLAVDAASSDIEVSDCRVESLADASSWTATDWINTASSGADVRGARVTLRRNLFRNVRFGISVTGADALVDSNQVVNFSADGLRGLGDRGVFQYNLVKNIYVDDAAGDANHDDGFQSWSVGTGGVGTGEVAGVVLRGNLFLSTDDPTRPLQATMQGIGCFDGYFKDWVVENNVVITDHWHGISLYGMRGGRIVNNTVIDVNTVSPGPPWIMVTAHKDGTPSSDVVVRNNLATDFNVSGTNVLSDHNTELTAAMLAQYFVAPATFDLHLVPGAPAVNAGSADLAPPLDRDRIPRPQGAAVDLGAYEWHDGSATPVDGGAPPATDGGSPPATDGGLGPDPDAGSPPPDGGSPAEHDGGTGPGGPVTSSCGCGSAAGLEVFGGLALLLLRRRRR